MKLPEASPRLSQLRFFHESFEMPRYEFMQRFLLVGLACSTIVYSQAEGGPTERQVSCQIIAGKNGTESDGEVAEVTNLQRIGIKFELVNIRWQEANALQEVLGVEVFRVDDGSNSIVPATLTFSGGSSGPGRRYVRASLMLSIPEERRRQNIETYLTQTTKEGEVWIDERRKKKDEVASSQLTLYELAQEKWLRDIENGTLMAALESRYVENRVGTFEMVCRYEQPEGDQERGEVITSRPVRFKVRNDGSFVDQLSPRPAVDAK